MDPHRVDMDEPGPQTPLIQGEDPVEGEPQQKQRREDIERLMESARKSAEKFDITTSLSSDPDGATPKYDIDEADTAHSSQEFPHMKPTLSGKGSDKHKKHSKSKKSKQFIPSLPRLKESWSPQDGNSKSMPQLATYKQVGDSVGQSDSGAGADKVGFYIGENTSKNKVDTPGSSDSVPTTGKSESGQSREPQPFLKQLVGDEMDAAQLSPVPDTLGSQDSSPQVKFRLGSDPDLETQQQEVEAKHRRKSSSERRKHHHHGRHKNVGDLQRRGSEVKMNEKLQRVPTEADEAGMLSGMDLDDMAAHRFGDPRGLRRHKISGRHSAMASVVHIGKNEPETTLPKISTKSKFDHSPHEMFVELEELFVGEHKEWEWREKARWIKFEEELEEGAGRWGKPHVSSLSFHSLLELRKCLEQGAVLLDLEVDDLPSIANAVVEQMVISDQLPPDEKGNVLKALLLKHKHVNEDGGFIKRNLSNLHLPGMDGRRGSSSSPSSLKKKFSVPVEFKLGSRGSTYSSLPPNLRSKTAPDLGSIAKDKGSSGDVKVDIDNNVGNGGLKAQQESEMARDHANLMRKIPKGAEATTVLIGSVDFLSAPAMAFVRLSEGRHLGNLTEVPLPVRFMFVLLGPANAGMDYHEVGRSISTLMANTKFHDVAYQADDRQDLLNAINEFLDESMVLPPGDWDKKTLLPIMDMAKKKQEGMRQRKLQKKQLEEKMAGVEVKEKDEDDPLRRTGRLFGGFVKDIRRRYPKYWSDIKDGLNAQCLASFFFIYFAALSPAITFGGLLSDKVDKWMGVPEMLVACAAGGISMGFFGCQPLNIVGATGPLLVFEEGMFDFSKGFGVEFMPMRVWIGIWVLVIATVLVMFEGSFLVKFFTRFTQEIFAFLIALIFIYEVFVKLVKIFIKHPLVASYPVPLSVVTTAVSGLNATQPATFNATMPTMSSIFANGSNQSITAHPPEVAVIYPNTALLSLVLTFGTFMIAYFLKQFRNMKFLGRTARRALGDFGVPISIIIMVLVDYAIQDTYTEKLDVPDGFSVTNSTKRGWFINPMGLKQTMPIAFMFAAIIPAFLIFILIFMETQITGMIVANPERNLKKGSGFHFDLVLVGVLTVMCGFLGLPFLTVAAVRTVSHASSLTVMSRTHAPGEKPRIEGVLEQRVTTIMVHLVVGLSVLLGPVLREVPIAVLFGIFLYMGVSMLSGIQLVDRLELMFMPIKHHPDVGYVRKVRTFKMHLFTVIQLVCLAVLWAVKSTPAALGFPFFLILLVPVRQFLLKLLFTPGELTELDKDREDGPQAQEDEDGPDFYQEAHMPV